MNDDALSTGLHLGNRETQEKVIDLYGDRLLRSAFLLCRSESEAKDFVQETLVQAFKSIHTFNGKSALYTWLHGILLNLTRHHARKQQRLTYTDSLPEPEPETTPATSTQDMAAASESLLAAIRQLSPQHRETVVLRYYEGLSLELIADRTGTSKGTVKSRLFYAIQELRKLIPDEMNLFAGGGTYR